MRMRRSPTAARCIKPQIVRDIIGPDGKVVRPFQKKVIRKMKVKPSVLRTMREAARNNGHPAPHLQPR